jgi:NADPH:quinone reductase-like Zn-dependent oxidoreductase
MLATAALVVRRDFVKAIVYDRYGSPDVLRCEEIPSPVPAAGEVLVRVSAAALNPLDWHYMRGAPYGFRFMSGLTRPKERCLGMDVAGWVEAVGVEVTERQPGDEVFGVCRGAFAEKVCARAANLIAKPSNIDFEQAAAAPVAAFTALQSLRDKAHIKAGQTLLVNGAAGGVGTFAIQMGKYFGAEVTGVCSSRNVDLVRSLGADHVVDYLKEDFTQSARRYDVMLDCIGNHSLTACRRILRESGVCILIGAPTGRWVAPMGRFLRASASSLLTSRRLIPVAAKWSGDDLRLIADLMASGMIKPVIDRRYPLDQVPDAIGYLEQGRARGKVIIDVA